MAVRCVGDVHGKVKSYLNLIKDVNYSIQLGDLGFDYTSLTNLAETNMIILGNHDCYNFRELLVANDLGEYGLKTIADGFQFGYVRGERSIDANMRVEGLDFFREEELTYKQLTHAIELIIEYKPKIILSHGCPTSCIPYLSSRTDIRPSSTAQALQILLENYQPKWWIHAHFHVARTYRIDKTTFVSLPELGYCDLPEDGNITDIIIKQGVNLDG